MTTLITAGLSGIGSEIANLLKSNSKNLDETIILTTSRQNEVNEENFIFYMDLNNHASIKDLFSKLQKLNLDINKIYHCAHSFSDAKLFFNISGGELQSGLMTNVVGTFEFLKIFTKQMSRKKEGRILIIGSNLAKKPAPGKLIYIIEKNAVEAMAMAMNSELVERNLKIKVIHPSLVATKQVTKRISLEVIEKIGEKNLISPSEVAKACVAFLEDEQNDNNIKIYNGAQQW